MSASVLPATPAANDVKLKVLIIDDSPVDRMLYRRMLTQDTQDYDVAECSSAEEALERIAEGRPHCMLLDYHLPGMSGIALMRRLSEGFGEAQIPTIMVTGLSEDSLALRAMQAGVDLLLAKGYVTRESLKEAIRTVVDGHVPRRMRILEAEYRYASVAYIAQDAEPSPQELAHFAIASELQKLVSALRRSQRSETPGGTLRKLSV